MEDNFVRKVDELGRIVLPLEYRRVLEIDVGDSVKIQLEGGKMTLTLSGEEP